MKYQDSAVSEIIGTVILFAIVVTLVTAYMSWYVPLQEERSQGEYYSETLSAITQFVSKTYQNSTFVQEFPSGIYSGIGSTADTAVSYSNSLTSSLNVTMQIELNASGKLKYVNETEAYTTAGILKSYPYTDFLKVETFNVYGNFISIDKTYYGPLNFNLSSNELRFNGVSLSSKGSVVSSPSSISVSGVPVESKIFQAVKGQILNLSGTKGIVEKITILSLNYTLNGSFSLSLFRYLSFALNGTIEANEDSFRYNNMTIKYAQNFLNVSSISSFTVNDFYINYRDFYIAF
ncbi:TVG1003975 [Thermoplasma volcanium GSS1]|uniref:TVG1003975 protein n=1 Tax=Thermoplasma volcanium (strain ATCC 51530 / DSM 4299 / JCM 9571 / NBRC 15438 / GSS1) TaxID=273116 RepID=Q97A28_THEVO|nr:archaellin/type IV pilin N-terminal domain-containing protein [Thermoplasma volcanium]BAB60124.1 TVG1003975 [Thermoplasma volcanium GSS1]